jgi:hypothetical protein
MPAFCASWSSAFKKASTLCNACSKPTTSRARERSQAVRRDRLGAHARCGARPGIRAQGRRCSFARADSQTLALRDVVGGDAVLRAAPRGTVPGARAPDGLGFRRPRARGACLVFDCGGVVHRRYGACGGQSRGASRACRGSFCRGRESRFAFGAVFCAHHLQLSGRQTWRQS